MYLKLGRLYLGLEKTTQGVKALKKVWQSLRYLAQQKSDEHKYIVINFHVLSSTVTLCTIVSFIWFFFFFSVSRHFPSWRWLMGKIIIMSLKSNEKSKSRSKGGTTWKEATAPKQQTPHHHCMHCILHICIFTCPLAYNDCLLRTVFFVCASSYSGQGRPQKASAAVSIWINKCSSRKKG